MPLSWDYRVVPAEVLDLLTRAQELVPSRVAGGAALSGVHLAHRLSRDVDVFFDDKDYKGLRLPAILDGCEKQSYHPVPVERPEKSVGPKPRS